MENGDQAPVIDSKGRNRGLKQWVVCPSCDVGRWVRIDGLRVSNHTGFCQKCHNKYRSDQMDEHPSWKGGRMQKSDGYIDIHLSRSDPLYPMARIDGYIREHRLVMARHLGRCLLPWEIVHHINGIRDDNRIENLELVQGNAHHLPSMVVQATIKRMQAQIDYLEKRLAKANAQLKNEGYQVIVEAEEILETKSEKVKHPDNTKLKKIQYTLWK